ncbi:sensor histidine kinase [Austwickia chelonae]|uniref:sensor histidine kinase n=1 Tax=Austwickia chelonae TaxID=100225 RepID=UPI000E23DD3A|nr:histidine kinase [Austwickia chelonae]
MVTRTTRPRLRPLPGSIHALAVLALLLAATAVADSARPIPSALTLASSVIATGLSWWLWSRSATPQAARRWCLLLAAASLAAAILNDSPLGMPVLALGLCSVAVEYGRRGLLATTAAYLGVVIALYLWAFSQGRDIKGGIVTNTVVIAFLILIGVLVADTLRQLTEAHRDALTLAEERRQTALRDLDRALAEERMAQARALHDEVGRDLTAVLMGAEVARRLRHTDPDAAWAEIDHVHDITTQALAGLRRQVRALSPLPTDDLDRLDLASALERLATVFHGTGLEVAIRRTDDAETEHRVDPLAYRIIQEGLTNVVRHSTATRVEILHTVGAQTTVQVHDNGKATATTSENTPSAAHHVLEGFGLSHLRSRVEAAGGRLTAGPTGQGFLLEATYPVETAA